MKFVKRTLINFICNDHECKIRLTLKKDFITFKVDKFSIKKYIVVTDAVIDVTYSRKSANTRVVITLFIT